MAGKTIPPVFAAACQQCGLGVPIPEYKFDPERKWRFDYAWLANLVALEIEGGAWTRGRHTRGGGFIGDMEKYNRAAALGWRIVRCTPKQFENGDVMADLAEAMTKMVTG